MFAHTKHIRPFTEAAIFTPSSKLEPAIWSRDTGQIVIHGGVDVCLDGRSHDDVIANTEISPIDGLPYFLNQGAPRARLRCNRAALRMALDISREVLFSLTLPSSLLLGSLSTPVFERRTATGSEYFARQDSGLSQLFKLRVSNSEKILSDTRENSSLPVAVRVSKTRLLKLLIKLPTGRFPPTSRDTNNNREMYDFW